MSRRVKAVAMEFIQLKSGPLVAAAAIALAVRLEADGFAMHINPETKNLGVVPRSKLTPELMVQIRQFRYHLMAIAAYKYEGPTP